VENLNGGDLLQDISIDGNIISNGFCKSVIEKCKLDHGGSGSILITWGQPLGSMKFLIPEINNYKLFKGENILYSPTELCLMFCHADVSQIII
jgi:hypothetical protein